MRKGQAAVEYLTTYGWVFLVVLVGISAISYFGLLNPDNFIPDRCWFGSQLVCEDYILTEQGSQADLKWKVRNNFARDIEITDIDTVDSRYPLILCNTPVSLGIGDIEELSCTVDANLFLGDKYSIPAEITLNRNDTNAPSHSIVGEVFTVVQ